VIHDETDDYVSLRLRNLAGFRSRPNNLGADFKKAGDAPLLLIRAADEYLVKEFLSGPFSVTASHWRKRG
jgi:hypothetical protein